MKNRSIVAETENVTVNRKCVEQSESASESDSFRVNPSVRKGSHLESKPKHNGLTIVRLKSARILVKLRTIMGILNVRKVTKYGTRILLTSMVGFML